MNFNIFQPKVEQIIQDTALQYVTANRKKKKTLLITGLVFKYHRLYLKREARRIRQCSQLQKSLKKS